MQEIRAIYNEETKCFDLIDDEPYELTLQFETQEQMDNAVKILKEAFKDGRI